MAFILSDATDATTSWIYTFTLPSSNGGKATQRLTVPVDDAVTILDHYGSTTYSFTQAMGEVQFSNFGNTGGSDLSLTIVTGTTPQEVIASAKAANVTWTANVWAPSTIPVPEPSGITIFMALALVAAFFRRR